ncbi:hypothetical protein POJ06DRAFT_251449 [Lipomyces tetrasporus]|uniref:Uncharacterized protein n=1 Tax=Lipomyces tetrasporus TaxID=54092 RepID=A0AAD7QU95_9ASCO|nr:uncharacterized protein POJ06DRAFT_251449 [Lipomyces tetrasporus]KAJ8101416.1 hypothetical protein POJ06DRAFT_251449 [Lipomyces tetrasporus]
MRVGVCILNRQPGISSRLRWPTSTLTRFVSLPYTKRRTITMSAHHSSRRAPRYLSIKEHYIPNLFPNTPFIDTHCHLRTTLDMAVQKHCVSESEVPSVQSLTSTFFPPEVEAVVDVYCDIPINNEWEVLADKDAWAANAWGGEYYFTMGCHPHSAKFYNDDVEAEMRRALSHPRGVAVGECGLDYKKSQSPHDVQRKVFARQIDLAVSLDKPLVVHTREAEADTIEILRAHLPREHRMHVHCFTDSVGMAQTLLSEFPNCVIGITGVITYQTLETTTELLKMGGRGLLGRLVLETDGPFMVPSNCQRKKKPVYAVSHSGMIPYTAVRVAELLSSTVQGVSAEEVLDITRINARRIYGL